MAGRPGVVNGISGQLLLVGFVVGVMVHVQPMIEPYRVHQRAILFVGDQAGDAHIGFPCTIASVCPESLRENPLDRDLWIYRVFVPSMKCYRDVSSRDLFVTGEIDSGELPPVSRLGERAIEICFTAPLREDNEIVAGAVYSPGRGWDYFQFQKRDQVHTSYQLHMPVSGFRGGARHLRYEVPRTERLHRAYVLRAITDIFGIPFLSEVDES